jgi:hypothetical protein
MIKRVIIEGAIVICEAFENEHRFVGKEEKRKIGS